VTLEWKLDIGSNNLAVFPVNPLALTLSSPSIWSTIFKVKIFPALRLGMHMGMGGARFEYRERQMPPLCVLCHLLLF
jgi:hypothetical protein